MSARRPPSNKRKQTSPRFFVFLAVAVLVVIVIFLIVWATRGNSSSDPAAKDVPQAVQTSAPMQTATTGDAQTSSAVHSTLADLLGSEDARLETLPEDQRVKVEDLSINPNLSTEWKNVLLLGTDERTLTESSRTDAIIICSVNSTTGEIKLTSVLRDLAVDYPEIGVNAGTYRINAANYFGGPELAIKKINECFDLNIESYVTVNFFGFQQIAHLLGGIDIDITEAEMNSINELIVQQAKQAYRAGIDESNLPNEYLRNYGENTHLDGRQTLAYARIRKLDSDISRAERQRIVLEALMQKLKGKDAMELTSLAAALVPYVKTNLSIDEILAIAVTMLSKDINIEKMYLPATGSYTQETRNGQAMLYDCNWQENTSLLHTFIYGQ